MTNQNILELLEATLGANQDKVPAPTDGSITSFLFPTQADFDVSYVNVADVAAAMGPVSNDQAGYVGSPLKPGDFTPLLNTFQSLNAWSTFIDLDGTNAAIPKLPSPLELMARLSGKNAPADITPLTPPQSWPTTCGSLSRCFGQIGRIIRPPLSTAPADTRRSATQVLAGAVCNMGRP